MIVVTTEQIEGKRITETLGLVGGSTIRARHVERDVMGVKVTGRVDMRMSSPDKVKRSGEECCFGLEWSNRMSMVNWQRTGTCQQY